MRYARVFARRRRHHRFKKDQHYGAYLKSGNELHYTMMENHEMVEEVIPILWNELKKELLKEKEWTNSDIG